MTKKEALAYFKENILPEIMKLERNRCPGDLSGGIDSPMRSQAWNDYTDYLCKDKRITSKQYNTWTNPF